MMLCRTAVSLVFLQTVLGSAATPGEFPGCMRLKGGSDFALLERKSKVIAQDYEIGKIKCDFKMQSAGAQFTPSYTREAYDRIVGTVNGQKRVGPLSVSATVDPDHRIHGTATLESLGNRIAVKQSFVPGKPELATNPKVMLDTRLPFFAGCLSASAASQIENPFSEDYKFLGWRSAFGQDVDLSVAITQGDLILGASSTFSPATDKYAATSRNSKAGFKWKGLGVMFYTPKSIEHIADTVQHQVDHLLVPQRENEGGCLWPVRLSARIPESVRIPSIMRTPKLEADAEAKTRPKPNSGKGSQQPATVTDSSLSLVEGVRLSCEQHLGPMTLAAAYSSADVWTAGMGTKLGSDWEVKGRMNSQNRGAGVLRGKLGENAEVRVSCEVLVSGTIQDMLNSRRLGLHFVFGSDPSPKPLPAPFPAQSSQPPPRPAAKTLETERSAESDRPMPGIKQAKTTHSHDIEPVAMPEQREPKVPQGSVEQAVEIPPVRTVFSQLRDKVLEIYNSLEAKPIRDAVSRTTGTAFQFAATAQPVQGLKQYWEKTSALLSDEEQKQAIVGKVEATAGAVAGLMGDAKEQLGAVVAKTSSKVESTAFQFASSPTGQAMKEYWDKTLPIAEQQTKAFVGQMEAGAGVVAGLMGDAKEQLGTVVAKTSSKVESTAFQFASSPTGQAVQEYWQKTLPIAEQQTKAFVGQMEAGAGVVAGLMGDAKEQLGTVVAKTSSQVGATAFQFASSPTGQAVQEYWQKTSAMLPIGEEQKNAFVGQMEANGRVVAGLVAGLKQQIGVLHSMIGEKLQVVEH